MEVRLRKQGYTKWAILGLVMAFLGLGIIAVDPLGKYVKHSMTLKEGTMMYEMWKMFPVEILMKIYLFNITNAEEFLNGNDDQLEVKEIGPYVYKETRKNFNLTINPNGTISYVPLTEAVYLEERSVGNLTSDILYTANVPLIGAYAMYKDSYTATLGLNLVTSSIKPKAILNLTVYDFLWGYEDKLLKIVNGYMPNKIPFSKFGLMDRMYEENKNQILTMDINMSSPELYTIQKWNGSPGLKMWNFTGDEKTTKPCSMLKGSFEGLLFPPNMEGRQMRVYKKVFCRPLRVNFVGEVTMPSGLEGHKYEMVPGELGCTDEYNSCYCPKDASRMPEGFISLAPCNYDIPLSLSYPHFYMSDPKLSAKIRGFDPSYEKHSSKIILQPNIGMPMEISTKNQLNLNVPKIKFNRKLKPFNEMIVPILWMDHCVEGLPEWLTQLVLISNKYGPLAQTIFAGILIFSGTILFLLMVYKSMRSPKGTTEIKIQPDYSAVALEAPEITKGGKMNNTVEMVKLNGKTIT